MDEAMQSVSIWFAVFAAVGLSTERVVQFCKNLIPWLDAPKKDANQERLRKLALRVWTIIVATLIVIWAREELRDLLPFLQDDSGWRLYLNCTLVGLMSSAGSDFWNQALSTMNKVNNIKRAELRKLRKELA